MLDRRKEEQDEKEVQTRSCIASHAGRILLWDLLFEELRALHHTTFFTRHLLHFITVVLALKS